MRLYFAYGSNLNWKQMKKERCRGAEFLQSYILKGYKLIFSRHNPKSTFGYANIEKDKNFGVPGAIWKIKDKHEEILDRSEGVPISYQQEYLPWKDKKLLTYIQNIYTKRKPSSDYFHKIILGYKNCGLDLNYLKKRISYYTISYDIKW